MLRDGTVSRRMSLFGKMQSGRSPSFEFFQLDIYVTFQYSLMNLAYNFIYSFELKMLEHFTVVSNVKIVTVLFCLVFLTILSEL